ncbi:XkdX family protein [Lactobacillus salivarius]|uniref:XkdX family protein n=1 Tax=Ligilactobacillus salivarius TaxID=1624 RepID=UPI00136FD99F|nr:XkdX family protein [Ligilactobacillus salivarius]MYZ23444.1 XkdX family protein [Ligilactobacillus salivarius]
MRYSYDIVKRFYDLGLFTKENVQLFVRVIYFTQEDYYKMFPEDKSAETTTSTQPTVAPTA